MRRLNDLGTPVKAEYGGVVAKLAGWLQRDASLPDLAGRRCARRDPGPGCFGHHRRASNRWLVVRHPQTVHEAGSWWIFLPGTSISADGATFGEAIDDAVTALREYAQDWADHLSAAVNHRDHWGLVQFVALSSDEQLAQWLRGQ